MPKLFFFCLILLAACSDIKKDTPTNDGLQDCKYQANAYFNPPNDKILNHSFKKEKAVTIEEIAFENGVSLEITQSGCELAKHELRFNLKGDFQNNADSTWVDQSKELLGYMGSVETQLLGMMNLIVEDLSKFGDKFPLGEMVQLMGYSIKIDKIATSEGVILAIDLLVQNE